MKKMIILVLFILFLFTACKGTEEELTMPTGELMAGNQNDIENTINPTTTEENTTAEIENTTAEPTTKETKATTEPIIVKPTETTTTEPTVVKPTETTTREPTVVKPTETTTREPLTFDRATYTKEETTLPPYVIVHELNVEKDGMTIERVIFNRSSLKIEGSGDYNIVEVICIGADSKEIPVTGWGGQNIYINVLGDRQRFSNILLVITAQEIRRNPFNLGEVKEIQFNLSIPV